MQTADLTIQKKKGKALTKAIGEVFAPEEQLRRNRELSGKKSSAGLNVGGKK